MKKYFTNSLIRQTVLTIILFLIFGVKLGLAQTWNWVASGSGSAGDYGNANCTDASGNIIVVGDFSSNPLQMGTVTLNNSGGSDAYVAKYYPNGTLAWAQRIGGLGNESMSGVTCDASGNVYVLGYYSSTFVTVAALPTISNYTNNGTYDMFVACYNSTGVALWIKSFGGVKNDFPSDCVFSNSLSCLYIAGSYYSPTIVMGTTTLTNTDATGNNTDIFLARLTSTGSVTWAKTTGSTNSNEGPGDLALDSNSDLYYCGYISPNSLTTTIGGTVMTTSGGWDVLFGKYNSSGTSLWAKNFGSTINCTCDFPSGISIDASNNIYLGATSNGTALIAGTFTNSISGGYDAFVVKTNSVGAYQWVTKVGAAGDQYANAVTNDNNGNVFLTGSFSGTNCVVGTTTLTNSSPGLSTEIFVLKLNSSGTALWSLSAAGPNADEQGTDITSDAVGNIFLSGITYSAPTSFGSTTITNTGASDVFLAKIGCLTPTITGLTTVCAGSSSTLTASGATSYTWNTSTVSSSIVVTPTAYTTYSLIAASGSCSANSSNYSVNVLPASVNAGTDLSLSCNLKSLINASCTPASPTNVQWQPTTGLSNASVLSPTVTAPTVTTQYIVTCTLSNGCIKKDTVLVSPFVPQPAICIVTVDSLNNNNEIYWDKLSYPSLDSMIIFREVSTGTYKQIGAVHRSAISLFTDTIRSIGPANGDPHISTYRYKIQIRDTCGVYGPKSLWHNTVFFSHTNSTFFWTNNYMIEGPTNPVISYSLMVCPNPTVNPNYQLVGTTAGNQNQLNDPNYNNYINTADWRVIGDLGYICHAQKMAQQGKSTPVTRSNISNNRAAAPDIGIREKSILKNVRVYPNPAEKFINVNIGTLNTEVELKLTDILGQLIYSEKTLNNKTIDVSEFSKGIYTLTIDLNGAKSAYKIIVN